MRPLGAGYPFFVVRRVNIHDLLPGFSMATVACQSIGRSGSHPPRRESRASTGFTYEGRRRQTSEGKEQEFPRDVTGGGRVGGEEGRGEGGRKEEREGRAGEGAEAGRGSNASVTRASPVCVVWW